MVNAPYAVKVEFHKNGWAHFHVVFLSRSYLPGGLLNALWGLGRTNARRIGNQRFRYLLKYVTKGGGLPEWVLGRRRLRVLQSSRGFLLPSSGAYPGHPSAEHSTTTHSKTRKVSNLGDRLMRWRRTATLEFGKRFRQVTLAAPFFDIVANLIFPAAMEGRYQGGGRFQINDTQQLLSWIT